MSKKRPQERCPRCGTALCATGTGSVLCPRCELAGALHAVAEQPFAGTIGSYELDSLIAHGGMGAVYRAHHRGSGQTVALKTLLAGRLASAELRERFLREARLAAKLRHPHIVPLLEVGEAEGLPYIAMEFVPGKNLADLVRDGPVPPAHAARLLAKAADAVAYAHEQGVLNRDIKPANILLDSAGEPRVADFGLARLIEDGATELTVPGQVLGSPAYLAPERLLQHSAPRGRDGDRAGRASDIYSLGATLYHLLTGRPPFQGATLEAVVLQVANTEPIAPRKLNPSVPVALETVCLKCLQKDPRRRYASAQELAADLGRWLAGEPILAQRTTRAQRFWRWCQRNPALSATGAVALLAVMLGLSGVLWEWRAASQAHADEQRMRVQAQAEALAARRKAYASDMARLQDALADQDFARAREMLARQEPQPGQSDLRGWEWRYFWQFCQGDPHFILCQRSNMIVSASFSSDGALLAVGTLMGEVTVWDIAGQQMIFRKEPASEDSGRTTFAPSGPILAFYDGSKGQKSVVLWDTDARSEVGRLGLRATLGELAFTRDGRLFTADLSDSNNITVWDTGKGIALSQSSAKLLYAGKWTVFDISSDGSRFAHTVGEPGLVRIVEQRGGMDFHLRAAEEHVNALAFSRDGRTLLTTDNIPGAIKLWDVRTGQLVGSLERNPGYTTRLRLLRDGTTLASGGADKTIRLWDLTTRQMIRTLRGAGGDPDAVDGSPDGRWLASGLTDGSVVLWDLTSSTNRPPAVRTLQPGGAERWAYSPDGRWVGAIYGTRLELNDASTLQPADRLGPALTNLYRFAFSPNMRLLVTTERKGNLAAYTWPSQQPVTNFAAHPIPHYEAVLAFTAGGTSLLALCEKQLVKEWDSATWKEIRRWQADPNTVASAFCPEADLFATVTKNGAFELVKKQEPEKRRRFTGRMSLGLSQLRLTFSPDGKTLAVADGNGAVELWDMERLVRSALLRGSQFECFSVTTSPDGRRVAASGAGQGAIRIWDPDSHEEVAAMPAGMFFDDVRFSPDGSTVGAQSLGGVLHFWHAPSWAEIVAAERARPAFK